MNCFYTALIGKTLKKYSAYTLLELLVVMSILVVLGSISFASFSGLENTIKMNEYTITLEQNIQSVQRASMLLERNSGENWLYGIGIDFGNLGDSGKYTVFKWCSPFSDYGNARTKASLPNYDSSHDLGSSIPNDSGMSEFNAYMPSIPSITNSAICGSSVTSSELRLLTGYDSSIDTPKSTITVSAISGNQYPRYVLFESVSGRAFFYDRNGVLLNYDTKGKLKSTDPFVITIVPEGKGSTRIITIGNLSGKVSTEVK